MNVNQDQDDEVGLPWVRDLIEGEELELITQRGAVPVEAWVYTSKDEVHQVRLLVTNEPAGPGGGLETQVLIAATAYAKRRLPTDFEELAAIKHLSLEVVDRSVVETGRRCVVLFGRLLAAA